MTYAVQFSERGMSLYIMAYMMCVCYFLHRVSLGTHFETQWIRYLCDTAARAPVTLTR